MEIDAQQTAGRAVRLLLKSAALILVATSFAKIVSVFGDSKYLDAGNPLFPEVSNRRAMVFVAFVELFVAWILFFSQRVQSRLCALSWLVCSFAGYRVGLFILDYSGPCTCLGNAFAVFGFRPEGEQMLTRLLLAYLIVVLSLAWVFHLAFVRQEQRTNKHKILSTRLSV